jgi:hopene-associated glycosyltransferase HpnB
LRGDLPLSDLALLAVVIWIYLLAFRGGFWRVAHEPPPNLAGAPSVVAVIPARDEANYIAGAVASLVGQDYPGDLRIVVVDDHSTDGTAAIARAAGPADKVTVITGARMPPGWTGKLWALNHGVAAAAGRAPEYLLLTDADIVHQPTNLRELVARAESEKRDLVSLMVRLHCRSAWERLLVPAFVFFFFKLYPPRWVASATQGTAAAAGGCVLLRRAALERIGGLGSIRGEIIDDCALAARVKPGGAIWLGLGDGGRSVRPYGSWRELWDMIARCAFAQLGYSAALLAGSAIGMGLTYLVPPLLVFFGHGLIPKGLGVVAWAGMSAAFVPMLRFYRCPLWIAPLLPLIALFYMAATCASAVQFWRGRGGAWKGRFQAPAARATRPGTRR